MGIRVRIDDCDWWGGIYIYINGSRLKKKEKKKRKKGEKEREIKREKKRN